MQPASEWVRGWCTLGGMQILYRKGDAGCASLAAMSWCREYARPSPHLPHRARFPSRTDMMGVVAENRLTVAALHTRLRSCESVRLMMPCSIAAAELPPYSPVAQARPPAVQGACMGVQRPSFRYLHPLFRAQACLGLLALTLNHRCQSNNRTPPVLAAGGRAPGQAGAGGRGQPAGAPAGGRRRPRLSSAGVGAGEGSRATCGCRPSQGAHRLPAPMRQCFLTPA